MRECSNIICRSSIGADFGPPFPLNPNAKVVRYSSDITQDAQTGPHQISLNRAIITRYNPQGPPFAPTAEVSFQNLIPGTFNVIPYETADFNKDGIIDSEDLAILTGCMTGPGYTATLSSECQPTDLDDDGNVDLMDAKIFGQQGVGDYRANFSMSVSQNNRTPERHFVSEGKGYSHAVRE